MHDERQTHSIHDPRRHDPKVRASDADREYVADVLRTQHAEGRLDSDELQQRIDTCYDVKTMGELDGLLSDLPRPDWRMHHWASETRGPRGLAGRGVLLTIVPVLLVIALVHAIVGGVGGGHHGFFWLAIPLTFLAVRLFAFRRYGRLFGLR